MNSIRPTSNSVVRLALGAGLLTSPKRLTAGLPKCAPSMVRGRRPAHSAHSARRPAHSMHGTRPTNSAHRSGFTLIEMLIVMTIFVFLLASAAMAIGTLFRAQGDLQDELVEANTASRLASQLRADAHLANSAEITRDGASTGLRLLLPNAEISYATYPRRIVRTVKHGER